MRKDFNQQVQRQAVAAFAGEAEQLVGAFMASVSEAASDPEATGSFEDRLIENIDQFKAALVDRVNRLPAADATTTKKRRESMTQDDAARSIDRLTSQLQKAAGIPWEKAYPQAVDIVATRQPTPRPQQVQKSAASVSIEKAAQEIVGRGGVDRAEATRRIFETRPDLVAAWRQEQMS